MSPEKKNKKIKKDSRNKKISDKTPSFLKRKIFAFSKLKNKKLYTYAFVLALGISLIPTSFAFGTSFELYTNDNLAKEKFPVVLYGVKVNLERKFDSLIEEMKDDPLDGLYVDKLPSVEEIFFAEWAEDKFPKVDIPVIGGYIERMGAKSVGDIDLDNQFSPADLNITFSKNPSGITYNQCKSLWNPNVEYSLTSSTYSIWFRAIEGASNERDSLKLNFSLKQYQLDLICNWLSVGLATWIKYLSREEQFQINPFIFIGLMIPSVLLIGYGSFRIRPEIKKVKSSKVTKLKEKPKSQD